MYLNEIVEISSLVTQWIGRQPIGKGNETVRKVVLRQPRHDFLLLHVGPRSYVDYQVAELLPMSETIIKFMKYKLELMIV